MTTKTHTDSADRAGEILGTVLYGVFRGVMIFWPALLALTLLAWGWSLDSWVDWLKCLAAGGTVYLLWPTQKKLVTRARMESVVRRLLARQSPWAAETPSVRARHGEASGTWRVTVATPHGATDEQVASLAPALSSRLNAFLVEAAPLGASARSGRVDFDIALEGKVLSSTIDESLLKVRPAGLVTAKEWRLPMGATLMGTPRMATLWTPAQGANRVLITGNSGTGKSSASLRIVRSAIDNGLKTYIFDPNAASVRGWSQQCTRFASTPEEFLDLITEVKEEFERREALIAAGKSDQIRPGLVLLEEVHALLSDPAFGRGGALQKQKGEVEGFLQQMALKARKGGLVFVLSLQDSAGESLGGTSVRGQFNQRFCFPLDEAKARLLLSDEGAHMCATLTGLPPGICVFHDASNSSELGKPHIIRLPAITAPPVEKEEEESPSAAEWSPWEERDNRAADVVEEAETILRSERRKNSRTNRKEENHDLDEN